MSTKEIRIVELPEKYRDVKIASCKSCVFVDFEERFGEFCFLTSELLKEETFHVENGVLCGFGRQCPLRKVEV